MKKLLSIGLILTLLSTTSINQPLAFPGQADTDDDGIIDTIDLDDDNDGIIDVIENQTQLTSGESSQVYEVGPNFYQSFDGGTFGSENGSPNQSPSTDPYPGAVSGGNFDNFYSIGKGEYGYVANAVDPRNQFQHAPAIDPLYGVTGRFFGADPDGTPPTISDTLVGLFEGATYQYSFWSANSEPNGNANEIQVKINGTEAFSTGPLATDPITLPWTRYEFTFQGPTATTSDFDLVPTRTGRAGNDFYIDNIEIRLLEVDTEGDGIRNHRDLDSDNDGIADIYEAGNAAVAALDTNGNGTIELSDGFVDNGTLPNSTANNGLDDRIENLIGTAGRGVTPVDSFNTASDNLADFLDLDSDDDGIPDATEARASGNYIAYPAIINDISDTDDDGILDIYDSDGIATVPGPTTFGSTLAGFKTGLRIANTDSDDTDDTLPDYIDTDTDGDGLLDSVAEESGTITGVSYADPDGNVNNPLTSGVLNNNDDNNNGTDVDVDFRSVTVPPVTTPGTLAFVNATNESAYTVSGTCTLPGDAITVSITSGSLTPILNVTTCQVGGTYSATFDASGFPEGNFTVRTSITDGVNPTVVVNTIGTKDTVAPMTTVNANTLTNGIDDPILGLSTIETQSGFNRFEIDYILNNNTTGVSSTVTTLNTTNFSETLDLDPDEAIHTIVVRTYDNAGNFSTITTILPPVINFTAGTQLSNTTINDIVFTVDTPTDQPLTNITISGAGATGATLTCVGDNNDTVAPYDDIATCTVTGVTASGPITVNAEDTSNGAVGQAQRSHVIHTIPPVITLTNSIEAGPVQSDDIVINVTDDFPDTTTYQYTFSPDATCNASDTFGTAFTTGATITFNNESENGNYLCVVATDLAGNTSYQGSTNPINIDITDPTITINEPVRITPTNEAIYPVSGSCSAPNDAITLMIGDGTNSIPQNTTCGATGTYSETFDISGLDLVTLDITADISDLAGNTGVQATAITDRDNISSAEENAGPNGGDANNDGTLDSEQANITTAINPNVGAYTITEVSGPDCSAITAVSFNIETDFLAQDLTRDYPIGLHGIELDCAVIGGTADITYYWDQDYDTSLWTYRKYLGDTARTYMDFEPQVSYGTAVVGTQTVTTVSFSITDGGPYDSDGVADGKISDPVGPTTLTPITPSGGGGAPKNYPLSLCSTENNQCARQYPTLFASTGNTYQEYQQCVSRGGYGFDCARAWATANGLSECSSSSDCGQTVPSQPVTETETETSAPEEPVITAPESPTPEPLPTPEKPEPVLPTDPALIIPAESLEEPALQTPVVLAEERPKIDQSICPIFTQRMSRGDRDGEIGQEKQENGVSNLLGEVRLLQQVLFNLGFYVNTIDGIFNQATHKAVSDWQVIHQEEVLDPWGLKNPTGRFYQSSERWMNTILGCDDEVQLDNGVWLD